ncbi:MAG: hypothetical protein ACLU0O_13450 [Collinsella sp.]
MQNMILLVVVVTIDHLCFALVFAPSSPGEDQRQNFFASSSTSPTSCRWSSSPASSRHL